MIKRPATKIELKYEEDISEYEEFKKANSSVVENMSGSLGRDMALFGMSRGVEEGEGESLFQTGGISPVGGSFGMAPRVYSGELGQGIFPNPELRHNLFASGPYMGAPHTHIQNEPPFRGGSGGVSNYPGEEGVSMFALGGGRGAEITGAPGVQGATGIAGAPGVPPPPQRNRGEHHPPHQHPPPIFRPPHHDNNWM